jgi:hypothetical protein
MVDSHKSIPACMRRHQNNAPKITRPILERKRKVTVKIYRNMCEIAQSVLERAKINAVPPCGNEC